MRCMELPACQAWVGEEAWNGAFSPSYPGWGTGGNQDGSPSLPAPARPLDRVAGAVTGCFARPDLEGEFNRAPLPCSPGLDPLSTPARVGGGGHKARGLCSTPLPSSSGWAKPRKHLCVAHFLLTIPPC